jgi:hypothetical protein
MHARDLISGHDRCRHVLAWGRTDIAAGLPVALTVATVFTVSCRRFKNRIAARKSRKHKLDTLVQLQQDVRSLWYKLPHFADMLMTSDKHAEQQVHPQQALHACGASGEFAVQNDSLKEENETLEAHIARVQRKLRAKEQEVIKVQARLCPWHDRLCSPYTAHRVLLACMQILWTASIVPEQPLGFLCCRSSCTAAWMTYSAGSRRHTHMPLRTDSS